MPKPYLLLLTTALACASVHAQSLPSLAPFVSAGTIASQSAPAGAVVFPFNEPTFNANGARRHFVPTLSYAGDDFFWFKLETCPGLNCSNFQTVIDSRDFTGPFQDALGGQLFFRGASTSPGVFRSFPIFGLVGVRQNGDHRIQATAQGTAIVGGFQQWWGSFRVSGLIPTGSASTTSPRGPNGHGEPGSTVIGIPDRNGNAYADPDDVRQGLGLTATGQATTHTGSGAGLSARALDFLLRTYTNQYAAQLNLPAYASRPVSLIQPGTPWILTPNAFDDFSDAVIASVRAQTAPPDLPLVNAKLVVLDYGKTAFRARFESTYPGVDGASCDAVVFGTHEDLILAPGGNFCVPAGEMLTLSGNSMVSNSRLAVGASATLVNTGTIRFGSASRLDVLAQGTLTSTGGQFVAENAAQGWRGISVASTATLASGTVVSGVRGSKEQPAALLVTGSGHLTLDASTVEGTLNGGGIVASGQNARATIIGRATVRDNAGIGVRALAGADVAFHATGTDIPTVTINMMGGVQAFGSGSRADIHAAQIVQNYGPAVEAAGGAFVRIANVTEGAGGSPSGRGAGVTSAPTTPSLVNDNRGGLSATGGSYLDTGITFNCVQEPCDVISVGGHTIAGNQGASNQHFDAQSFAASEKAGSVVSATGNRWRLADGYTLSDLVRLSDAPSTLSLCPLVGGSCGPGAAQRGGAGVSPEPAPDAPSGVAVAVLATEGYVQEGQWDRAARSLVHAFQRTANDDDRGVVAAAAGRLLAGASDGDAALLRNWVAQAAQGTGAMRPWAARAEAVALLLEGNAQGAAALALPLTVLTGHAAFAHRLRVEAGVASTDSALAVSALVALAALDTAAAEPAAVLVGLTFPGVDLEAVLAGGARQNSSAAFTSRLTPTRRSLTVSPNPAASQVGVTFTLDTPEEGRVTVHDALGREVAVLASGALADGPHRYALSAQSLAPGVYLVRVQTERHVEARTLTVIR